MRNIKSKIVCVLLAFLMLCVNTPVSFETEVAMAAIEDDIIYADNLDIIFDTYKDVGAYAVAEYTGNYKATTFGDTMVDLYPFNHLYCKFVNNRTDFHGLLYTIDEAKDAFGSDNANVLKAEAAGRKYYAPGKDNSFRYEENVTDVNGVKKDAWFTDAYFRADIRRCNHEAEIDGRKYSVYARGPVENSLNWKKGNLEMYNELNYTLIMYITKDEFTLDYFERFKKIKIDNKPWEVQAVDTMSSVGIIEVALKETFSNTLEEEMKDAETETNGNQEAGLPHIVGSTIVYPYETYSYSIDGLTNGVWSVDNMKLVKINEFNNIEISISIKTGRSGNFTLSYISGSQTVELPIVIESI